MLNIFHCAHKTFLHLVRCFLFAANIADLNLLELWGINTEVTWWLSTHLAAALNGFQVLCEVDFLSKY